MKKGKKKKAELKPKPKPFNKCHNFLSILLVLVLEILPHAAIVMHIKYFHFIFNILYPFPARISQGVRVWVRVRVPVCGLMFFYILRVRQIKCA